MLGLVMLATMRVTSTGAAAVPPAAGACVSAPLLRKLPNRGASRRLRANENSSRISLSGALPFMSSAHQVQEAQMVSAALAWHESSGRNQDVWLHITKS